MDYKKATEFLLALPDMERSSQGSKARTMSLDAMRSLLGCLGNPQSGRFTVHTTGSKGKGSTSAMIAAMLSASSATSLYSSPHLHSYRERICLDLLPVSRADFSTGVEVVSQVVNEHDSLFGPISTFGAMSSLFFLLSRMHHMKWQVVEVGMGGLFDATNVFDRKELVVISAISLEHTNMLGKTTLEIAENKAGIIRPGCTVVLAPQKDPEVSELLKRICDKNQARFIDVIAAYNIEAGSYDREGQSLLLSRKAGGAAREFRLKMLGRHQLDNAATALAAVDALAENFELAPEKELKEAIESVFVPGRLELMQNFPAVVIDGAHNGESMEALLNALSRHYMPEEKIFLLGVNSDKNIEQILKAIGASCKKLIATRSANEKAMDPALIHECARRLGIDSQICESSHKALELALGFAGKSGLVCATGSLYLVAEIREYFLGEDPPWSLSFSKMHADRT